ncbi:hypothetical protein [Streptomyces sp. NBC_00091]|uniref:hypothetical protein n=1 Tax=Streptomyces sp. NBC_00091 TaxID=2975648 RepID=UPI00224F135C|nr:hypothetical protein [Streptomyces sp. NBC_00091]MCX5380081.1 hypothetical protein [Streptomyces sp. NBC_00091]
MTRTAGSPAPAARRKQRLAWYGGALLSSLLVVTATAWQVRANVGFHTRAVSGGSAGRAVTSVEIEGGRATVTVTPRGDREVGYRAEMNWSFKAPAIEESWLGDTLKLTPRCPGDSVGLADGAGCSVRLAVTVPAGIPVKVTGTSGDVSVSGLEGTVDADVESGALTLTGLRGALRARAGSGELRATALASPQADIRAGTGRAEARFLVPPQEVTARVGAGRLDLVLPPESRYRVTSRAGVGRCEVADALRDPSATGTLDISAESGHATAGYRPGGP